MGQPPYIPGPRPGPHPPQHYGPPPTPKKSKLGLILGIAGGVLALCCGGVIAVGIFSDDPSKTGAASPPGRVLSTATPAVGPTTKAAVPALADIKLTTKITHRECFGSAGCNIEFEVGMTYSGPPLSDADTWRITYEVDGVEDAPLIDTLTVTGDRLQGTSQTASLVRASDKVTVKATDVELR